jgi:glycerophosphoryl diester phosphodiesterase
VKYTLLDAPTVASLKQQVSMVSTWGINDSERLHHAIDWGVDAIITDEESIMRQAAARASTP